MDDIERRLEALSGEVSKLRHTIYGNGAEGLSYSIREMQEVLYGGKRIPEGESVVHAARVVRDNEVRLKFIRNVLVFLGVSSLGGFVTLLAFVSRIARGM